MLYNFKDFLNIEIVRGFESTILSGPRKRLTIFTVWFELKERIVDAVKQDLVVNVLTLSN